MKKILLHFIAFYAGISSATSLAAVRVGQSETAVSVQTSETDCKLELREEDLIDAAERFANFIVKLQEPFKNTPWSELADLKKDEMRLALIDEMRTFYKEQAHDLSLPKILYNDPQLPVPDYLKGQ